MLTYILLALLALVIIILIVIAMQPSHFRVTRSAEMAAPPRAVFEQVNDFHNWNDWSPWAKMDPDARNTFTGPASGEGASMAWAGNKNVGEGSMTITESKPDNLVRIRLDFLKPFKGTSDVEFNIQPSGDRSHVTWTMSGPSNFIGKAMGLFMNCEKMIGSQYEQGLANIRNIVENQSTNS